jgi:hypothetical protein
LKQGYNISGLTFDLLQSLAKSEGFVSKKTKDLLDIGVRATEATVNIRQGQSYM